MKYLLTGLLLAFSVNVIASDVMIYRWVDSNNVVHFSQNQPETGEYTEILMSNANLPSMNNSTTTINKNELLSKKNKEKSNVSEDTKASCEEAKHNLATLTDFDRIRFVDSNGETQILDEAAQKEQMTINQKRIEAYCK